MTKSLWLGFAAAAVWFWASLVPQVTYQTTSSGEPAGHVLIAWPGWAVQQDIGTPNGTIGRFEIWVSSDIKANELTLLASIVDASTKEVLRQTRFLTNPSYTPVARTLTFPSYDVPQGQQLLLQLEVAPWEGRHAVYGLSQAHSTYANLALNVVPDAGEGPLAFAHYVTNSGLRAAISGERSALTKLALALALTALAALAHPRVKTWANLRDAATAVKRLVRPLTHRRNRLIRPNSGHSPGHQKTRRRRLLEAPVYPWLVPLIPILHFLASNPLHFSVGQALVPTGVILLFVTITMAGLRLLFKGWNQPAAAVSAVAIVIFAYGHIDRALDGRLDDHTLFPIAAVVAALSVSIVARSPHRIPQFASFLNITLGTLLLFQTFSLLSAGLPATVDTPRQFSPSPTADHGHRPDIYYIVLDAYGRRDTLEGFDNSSFLEQLQQRGFYIATDATSNYRNTIQSLASSLNFAYLHNVHPTVPKTPSDGINLIQNNALAATLQTLGYTYVHLESGSLITNRAPTADILVTFTPAGVVVSSDEEVTRHSPVVRATQDEGIRHSSFLRSLIDTTALRPLTGHQFRPGDDSPYDWWSPERTLQMFEVLSDPPFTSGPAFIFAHIIKPHDPATFDRHGNMLISHRKQDEFSDTHDPTVPDAFTGQLIFLNSLILRTVDRILEGRSVKPIIIIASDHSQSEAARYAILAAFHFPDGGNTVLYPSISSVNHFRSMLDYYFGFDLGLLEDIRFDHDPNQFDIPITSTVHRASQ